ncbi:helix-turn-helix domain-containing protein [Novosphingobium sp.]|uniref:helix-turn-helix domain-containing protein n=1 Tax=Novosphingobium sp. TaxID=1874826 RepID=UPI0038BCCF8D
MIRGERVEARLKVLGKTHAWLAERTGMSRQAIGRIINGGTTDSPHIFQIARALETSPEYLSGEIDDDALPPPSGLSEDEWRWLEKLRRLSPEDRNALLRITKRLSSEDT